VWIAAAILIVATIIFFKIRKNMAASSA
jgi:hypothetical protein